MTRKKTATKPTKATTPTNNSLAYGLLALFGLPFALIGAAAGIAVLKLGYDDLRMQFWTETPCNIVSATLIEEPGEESMLYRVKAEYRYEWQGIAHHGTRVSLMDSSADSSKNYHQRIVDELTQHRQEARPFRCWVNSLRPSEAVLYRDGQWGYVALVSLTAVVFGGVGFGLLGIVFYSWSDDRSQRNKNISSQDVWLTREDWKNGEIVHSDRKSGRILSSVSIAMLIFSTPSFLISLRAVVSGNGLACLGLIPAAISLLTQRKAHKLLSRGRHFGDSVLHLATIPGVIGGQFRGVIRPQRLTESANGYQLRLACTETSRSSGDDDTTTSTVWHREQTVIREDADGMAIPVMFHLPFDAPATEIDPERDRRTWKLTVKSLTVNHGYQAEFEVPICRTSESKPNYEPPKELPEFLAKPDPLAALKAGGVVVEQFDGGYQFTFPRGRHLGFAITMLVVHLIVVAAVIVGLYFYWKSGWIYVAAVLGFGLLWAIFEQLFHSEVTVNREGIVVRSGWFLLGSPRSIAPAEIQEITLTAAGSAGSVTAFDVHAKLKTNSQVVLAKRIIPSTAAKLFKSQVNRLMHNEP